METAARSPVVMNYLYVMRQFGLLLAVMSLAMATALGYEAIAFLGGGGGPAEVLASRSLGIAVVVGLALGGALFALGNREKDASLARREALLLVEQAAEAGDREDLVVAISEAQAAWRAAPEPSLVG